MDVEESKARAVMSEAARTHNLDVFGPGAMLRRTSSRFCLSVEHGDYNGTELFGVGTDRFIWVAYKPNGTPANHLFSVNFPDDGVVSYTSGSVPAPHSAEGRWAHFPYGVDYILTSEGYRLPTGIDVVVYGNIPGGGMSRSASLTLNLILDILQVNGLSTVYETTPMKIVDMSQAVENKYIGSPSGNLDQIMILFAKDGQGTHYIPKTREVRHVKFGGSHTCFKLLVLDTGTTRHGLEHSSYSIRAAECKQMVALAGPEFGISSLADIKTKEMHDRIVARFGTTHPHLVERMEYIYQAQERFYLMLEAWKNGDIETVGNLFRLDGIGLRDLYRISGPELETMCDIVRAVPGVMGERMLGGGDKGASGLLCRPDAVPWVMAAVKTAYPRSRPDYSTKYAVHDCSMVEGIKMLSPLS
ncbi:GHMP kinase [Pelomyxa schiedti]|nr:GHMP kinase [Pelomyxa schiedti]